MLKTTFTSYKERFKEIMRVLKIVIILEVLIAILGMAGGILSDKKLFVAVIFVALALIVLSIIQWLIYSSAAYRTIQKRELGEAITIEQATEFQKNDKWNFFMLSVWMLVYGIFYAAQFIAPIALGALIGVLIFNLGTIGMIAGGLIMLAGFAVGIYFLINNIAKLFFAINIYFVKNLAPRDCVRESALLGISHRNQTIKFIVGVFVINIVVGVLTLIPFLFNPSYILSEVEPTLIFTIVSTVWSLALSLLVGLPMMYLYMSKAYAKIRAITEPTLPHVVVSPEVVQ